MELSEAKELLKEMKENAMYLRLYHDKKAHLKVEAIDTVLKALDNSISKEYYEMTTKDLSNIINDLKARLDNSISKDEVEKVIDEINIKLDNDDFKHDMYMETAKYEDYLCLVANRHCLEKLLGE
jgi:hypothetical protein